jgi:hypothetical protein
MEEVCGLGIGDLMGGGVADAGEEVMAGLVTGAGDANSGAACGTGFVAGGGAPVVRCAGEIGTGDGLGASCTEGALPLGWLASANGPPPPTRVASVNSVATSLVLLTMRGLGRRDMATSGAMDARRGSRRRVRGHSARQQQRGDTFSLPPGMAGRCWQIDAPAVRFMTRTSSPRVPPSSG